MTEAEAKQALLAELSTVLGKQVTFAGFPTDWTIAIAAHADLVWPYSVAAADSVDDLIVDHYIPLLNAMHTMHVMPRNGCYFTLGEIFEARVQQLMAEASSLPVTR